MGEKELMSLLYTIYSAGFTHGNNENGMMPEHGTFGAFNRLIKGESPLEDGEVYYNIKEKMCNLKTNLGLLDIEDIK